MKTLWVVGAGIETVPGIKRAQGMGHFVVASDMSGDAPGMVVADQAIIADTYDADQTVAAAVAFNRDVRPLDGVICIAADVPLTVARVAEELGLPGISVETAALSTDKLAMKERFLAKGIACPWFSAVSSPDHLRQLVEARKRRHIIKPVDSRGARGVAVVDPDSDLDWCFDQALAQSRSRRVMLEDYLEGPQISTEALVLDGVGHTVGFTDRNYDRMEETHPFIIENGGGFPSRIEGPERADVEQLALQAGLALGVKNGVVKGDMVLTADGPRVIEVATRLSGGWFSTDQIPLGLGVDLVGCAIDLALGNDVDPSRLRPSKSLGVAVRFFFPKPGRVTSITRSTAAEGCDWLYKEHFYVGVGDIIGSPENHTERAGFVITTGDTAEQAAERAERIAAETIIETETV